jgi:hypothetical protein
VGAGVRVAVGGKVGAVTDTTADPVTLTLSAGGKQTPYTSTSTDWADTSEDKCPEEGCDGYLLYTGRWFHPPQDSRHVPVFLTMVECDSCERRGVR